MNNVIDKNIIKTISNKKLSRITKNENQSKNNIINNPLINREIKIENILNNHTISNQGISKNTGKKEIKDIFNKNIDINKYKKLLISKR